MAGGVVVSRWISPEKVENFDHSPLNSEQVHVLAVDDSLVDRKVIERLLKITSCKVTAVDSGRRALQFLGLGEEQVDMVITDYCMPEMTGYELLKKIKESSNFKEIPVVIMSSENVLSRIDSCLEEGAEDFIVKPVKLADVKRLRDSMTSASATTKRIEVFEVCARVADEATLSTSPPSISSSESSSPSASGVLTSALEPSSPAPLDSTVRRLEMAELL